MKIAFITPRMIVGGAETYIIRKAKWLMENGNDIVVISEGGCLVESLPKGVKHIQIKNISDPPFSISYKEYQRVITTLAKVLTTEKINIIEAHNTYAIIYTFLTYKWHHIPFLLNILAEGAYDKCFELRAITRILDKHHLYFTLTDKMNVYIEKKCHCDLHPTIIPIPYDNIQDYHSTTEPVTEEYILSVARLSSEKMYIKHLIKDFGELLNENLIPQNVILKIVGDGLLADDIRKHAQYVNNLVGKESVKLLGTVTGDKLESLFLRCSLYIGVGTTILISAAYSKPTIIGSGIMQEYAFGFWGEKPDEDRNVIGGDESMIARKISFKQIIQQFYSMPVEKRRLYGIHAHNLLIKHFSINQVMTEWERCYASILSYDIPKTFNKEIFCLNLYYNLLRPLKIIRNLIKRPLSSKTI